MESEIQPGIERVHGYDETSSAESLVQRLHSDLNQLVQQRAEVMRNIATIKKTILGLALLFGDNLLSKDLQDLVGVSPGERKPGLTKACRFILMDAESPLSAHDVVDQLQSQSPAILAEHKDPLASVTTVLNRLADYKEAQRVFLSNGRRAWKWAVEETCTSINT